MEMEEVKTNEKMNSEIENIVNGMEDTEFRAVGKKVFWLRYYDETWGSCRHWQIIESVYKANSIEHAKEIIQKAKSKEISYDAFTPAWKFSMIIDTMSDSNRNRHRNRFYMPPSWDIYVIRRWIKIHPSCNRGRWKHEIKYYIVENGIIKEIH